MKESLLDILMYLFEHYMDGDNGPVVDEKALREHLDSAGFHTGDIDKAFAWLDGLAAAREHLSQDAVIGGQRAFRIHTAQECAKLDTECRGFLLYLEQIGVLDAAARELVIDRAMALDSPEVDLHQLKWVVLMVLFNQPGQEAAYAWMEDLVFDEVPEQPH